MSDYSRLNVKLVNWEQVKSVVEKANPALAKIIDAWNPSFPLYEASYPYGAVIIKNGVFHLPLRNDSLARLQAREVPSALKDDLSYTSLPLGLVLNNSVEVYSGLDEAEVSLGVFAQGAPLLYSRCVGCFSWRTLCLYVA
jgi:hypothetical protein